MYEANLKLTEDCMRAGIKVNPPAPFDNNFISKDILKNSIGIYLPEDKIRSFIDWFYKDIRNSDHILPPNIYPSTIIFLDLKNLVSILSPSIRRC